MTRMRPASLTAQVRIVFLNLEKVVSLEEKIISIRDEDLRAEVEAARGGFLFAQIVDYVVNKQRARDIDVFSNEQILTRQSTLSRDQRRRDIARLVIENEPAIPANLQHIHSVLALCGLPYRDPGPVREFVRTYGKNSLNLVAGRVKDPRTGNFTPQGLPYGPKARLLLLHLCTEAVRQRSPVVRVADTLSGFMREMGFAVTGGERGTIRQFKEQLNRLAACTMQIGLWDGQDTATTLNVPPFRSLELWRDRSSDGEGDGARTVRFDTEFYETLIRHALPVDMRAARAFSGSARKLDLLFWTGYRLRALQRPLRLTWNNLHGQFGAENASLRSFRQAFKADLTHLCEVFPRLKMDLDDNGLILYPVDSQALLVPLKKGTVKRIKF